MHILYIFVFIFKHFCTGDDMVLRRHVLAESLAEYNAIVTFMAGERERACARERETDRQTERERESARARERERREREREQEFCE